MADRKLLLGIDVGTTKTAATIVDSIGKLLASASRPHEAGRAKTVPIRIGITDRHGTAWGGLHQREASPVFARAEQDVDALLDSAWRVVKKLPATLRRRVASVGVAGQMHGVVVLDKGTVPLLPLVTWEDQRCLEGWFLDDLKVRTGYPMRTGFGGATLAWYVAEGKLPARAASACTVHDLVVARLCGLRRPVTDATGAASWGLFDLRAMRWDARAVRAARIPVKLLPNVLPCGARAGRVTPTQARKFGIPAGIPVAAAIGDNQASVFATLDDPETELALNIGTGGQLSAVLHPGTKPVRLTEKMTYDCRPFPGKRFMLVAPLLAGGSAWAWLAGTVERWLREFGATPPKRDAIYRRLNELGLAACSKTVPIRIGITDRRRTAWGGLHQREASPVFEQAADALTVKPHFLGERYDASLRASVSGIGLGNFTPGNLSRALARGLLVNLKGMLPEKALAGRTAVVGSGNALRRNPLLQEMAREVFGLPLRLAEGKEEAARGAALNAAALAVER